MKTKPVTQTVAKAILDIQILADSLDSAYTDKHTGRPGEGCGAKIAFNTEGMI